MFDLHQFNTRALLVFFILGAICVPLSSAQLDPELHPKYSVQFFQLQLEHQDLRIAK